MGYIEWCILLSMKRKAKNRIKGMTELNIRRMYEKQGLSTMQIAQKLSCNDESVRKAMKRYNIKIRTRSEAAKNKKMTPEHQAKLVENLKHFNKGVFGDKHPAWKGGRYLDSYGYVIRRIDGKTVKEHRWVMEQHMGRKLFSWEEVNHINFDKQDNSLENLEICINEHKRRDMIARKRQRSTDKIIKLLPEQAKAYAEMSGFPNDGNVQMRLSSDEVWDLFEKLVSP